MKVLGSNVLVAATPRVKDIATSKIMPLEGTIYNIEGCLIVDRGDNMDITPGDIAIIALQAFANNLIVKLGTCEYYVIPDKGIRIIEDNVSNPNKDYSSDSELGINYLTNYNSLK